MTKQETIESLKNGKTLRNEDGFFFFLEDDKMYQDLKGHDTVDMYMSLKQFVNYPIDDLF